LTIMNRKSVAAAIAATSMLAGFTGASLAQAPAGGVPAQTAAYAPNNAPPPNAADAAPAADASSSVPTHSVLRITSVEIIRSAHAPYLDIVRARGLASSMGWEEAELVPLSRSDAPDGILHLVLVARPPEAATQATGFEAIEAVFPLGSGHPFKGVNVHGATNAVVVESLPGYAESAAVADDCGKCVGKIFVPKGGAAPAGGDVVREEQLPPATRIVRPTDGVMGVEANPNRLTLILNKEDRIVNAVWD
jgi:hypothetical protein